MFLGPEPSVEFWSSWVRSLALTGLGAQQGFGFWLFGGCFVPDVSAVPFGGMPCAGH